MAEGLLFAAVGKPIVHPDLCDQIRAQTSKLGGGHSPLETLCPGGGRAEGYEILKADAIFLEVWPVGYICPYCFVLVPSVCLTCYTPLPVPLSPPCWGSSVVRRRGRGSAGMLVPI